MIEANKKTARIESRIISKEAEAVAERIMGALNDGHTTRITPDKLALDIDGMLLALASMITSVSPKRQQFVYNMGSLLMSFSELANEMYEEHPTAQEQANDATKH